MKYFFWEQTRFSQAVRTALHQYGQHVPLLVLVSIILVVPNGADKQKSLKMLLEKSFLGVVICEMPEVTEEIRPALSWKQLVREVMSKLPPDHEIVGLEPDEVLEHFRLQVIKEMAQRQERLEQRQERLEQLLQTQFEVLNQALQKILEKIEKKD